MTDNITVTRHRHPRHDKPVLTNDEIDNALEYLELKRSVTSSIFHGAIDVQIKELIKMREKLEAFKKNKDSKWVSPARTIFQKVTLFGQQKAAALSDPA